MSVSFLGEFRTLFHVKDNWNVQVCWMVVGVKTFPTSSLWKSKRSIHRLAPSFTYLVYGLLTSSHHVYSRKTDVAYGLLTSSHHVYIQYMYIVGKYKIYLYEL
jgi:hypothetical protein